MTPCWIWNMQTDRKGYGLAYRWQGDHNKCKRIHVALWEELNGSLPAGMNLHHLCGTKPCYRPDHLLPVGTWAHKWLHADRDITMFNLIRSVCKRGHLLSGDNLKMGLSRSGYPMRNCRTCINLKQAERRAALALAEKVGR